MGVFGASGQARTFDFRAGDVGYVPFCHGPLRREHRHDADAISGDFQKQLLRRCVARPMDDIGSPRTGGGALEVGSAGHGCAAQEQSARRACLVTSDGQAWPTSHCFPAKQDTGRMEQGGATQIRSARCAPVSAIKPNQSMSRSPIWLSNQSANILIRSLQRPISMMTARHGRSPCCCCSKPDNVPKEGDVS